MKSGVNGRVAAVVLVGWLTFCSVPLAHADDSEARTLRRQVNELELRLLNVEKELEILKNGGTVSSKSPKVSAAVEQNRAVEQQPSRAETQATAASTTPTQGQYDRRRWANVTDGMTQAQISSLLGPAHRAFVLNGKTVWYYSYPEGTAGSVFFNADGRASSYQKPGLWAW